MNNLATIRQSNWEWNTARNEAAQLVADGELNGNRIAAKLKISRDTLRNWSKVTEFAARVAGIRRDNEALIFARGIANKSKRVEAANDRWNRLKLVMEERAADPDMKNVPGGKSGLLVKDIKNVTMTRVEGTGADQRKHYSKVDVATYAVDTGLLSEMRNLEKHVAQETGQWVEKRAVDIPGLTGTGNSQSEIDLSKIPLDKLEAARELLEMAKPDEDLIA